MVWRRECGPRVMGHESIMGQGGRERPEGSPLVESGGVGGLRPDVWTASWRRSSREVGGLWEMWGKREQLQFLQEISRQQGLIPSKRV